MFVTLKPNSEITLGVRLELNAGELQGKVSSRFCDNKFKGEKKIIATNKIPILDFKTFPRL